MRGLCVALGLMLGSFARSAELPEVDWSSYESGRVSAAQQKADIERLQSLERQLSEPAGNALLDSMLRGAWLLSLERLMQLDGEAGQAARTLREKALSTAMASAESARLRGGSDIQQDPYTVTLPSPGYWRLEGDLPPGAYLWEASCAIRVHPAAREDLESPFAPLWRTRIADDWRRTVTLVKPGALADQWLLNVPDACPSGVRIDFLSMGLTRQPLYAIGQSLVDEGGNPLDHTERELMLYKSCRFDEVPFHESVGCLMREAFQEWLFAYETDNDDSRWIGMPVILSRFQLSAAEPSPAVLALNIAFYSKGAFSQFPGCEDMITTNLLGLINQIPEMERHGHQLVCDNDRRNSDGLRMPIALQERSTPMKQGRSP